MKSFLIRCENWNREHTKFSLFDPAGANCGFITIRTQDLSAFIDTKNWNGRIDWNGKLSPEETADEGV